MPPLLKTDWDGRGDLRASAGPIGGGSVGLWRECGPLWAERGQYIHVEALWLMSSPSALLGEGSGGGSMGTGLQDLVSSLSSATC